MRARDIVVGETYRLKSSPHYGYIKALLVIPAKATFMGFMLIPEEIVKMPFITVKCEHTVNKNDTQGFIRYFKPVDIIREETT